MQPEVEGRPVSLLRCPDGADVACFFQKHVKDDLGGIARVMAVDGAPADEESHAPDAEVVVRTLEGTIRLVQRGVIEFHAWGSSLPRLDRADRLVIDLDPDDAVPWPAVVDAAHATRALLDAAGLPSWPKTTGGKGLHVVVPLKPVRDWKTVKAFAHDVADRLAAAEPSRFLSKASKAERKGKIFVDWLRNAQEATAVAAWSVRARDGAPVAMPLTWDELDSERDVRGAHFNVRNAAERLDSPAQKEWAAMQKKATALGV